MSKTQQTTQQRRQSSCKVYLNNLGIVNALGSGKEAVRRHLSRPRINTLVDMHCSLLDRSFLVGPVHTRLPKIPSHLSHFICRNNQLILAGIQQIEEDVRRAIERYTPERVGIVMGTSTSGVSETEQALLLFSTEQHFPPQYNYTGQEIGSTAEFLTSYLGTRGPAYVVSTACSSSAKVFASARGLIELGFCDAVIVGGADSLCQLTLGGFASLEAMSTTAANPFSLNRDGINIGEAVAVFLMTKEQSKVQLLGVGESSDAYHMSAPEPNGKGALAAMQAALDDADIGPSAVDYVNLHGTGTKLNDSMESRAVFSLFGNAAICSSTKPLTGHTLGAAGATELGLCWLMLDGDDRHFMAPHQYDGVADPELSPITLGRSSTSPRAINCAMSNSFAFGGSNACIVIGRTEND